MPTQCNTKFANAPMAYFCGKTKCATANGSLGDEETSCDSYDLRQCPDGYITENMVRSEETSMLGCFDREFDHEKVRKCKKDPKSNFWNPIYSELLDKNNALNVNDDNFKTKMEKAIGCCHGDALDTNEKEECGDLLQETDDNNCDHTPCDSLSKKFCLEIGDKDQLKDPRCQKFCAENPEKCTDRLKDFCSDKVGNSQYDTICGCYYPDSVYNSMIQAFSNEWNVPGNLLDTRPVCMFPKCENASIKPLVSPSCKPVTLSTCIQNIDIDAENAYIKNISMKQSALCKNKFVRKEVTASNASISDKQSQIDSLENEISELTKKYEATNDEETKTNLQNMITSKEVQKRNLESELGQMAQTPNPTTSPPTTSPPTRVRVNPPPQRSSIDDNEEEGDEDEEDNTHTVFFIVLLVIVLVACISFGLAMYNFNLV